MSWATAPLREIAPPIIAQCSFPPDEKVWQLSLDQIEGGTGKIIRKRYAPASEAGTSTFSFDTGNVLYSKLRPYLNKVALPDERGIATTELIPLRPNPSTLNRRFLGYYLRSPGFVNQASHHVAGTKMPRVMMDWFWGHEVPIPPPKEQSRIVELLDEANRLRGLRREADIKAARVLPALFLHAFGDPAANPKGWPTDTLSNVCDEIYRYPTYYNIHYVERGVPEIRGELLLGNGVIDTQSSKLRFISPETAARFPRTSIREGDIVMTVRGTIGKLGLVSKELEGGNITANLLRISPNRGVVRPLYLFAFLSSSSVIDQVTAITTSTTISTFKASEFQKLRIPTPTIHIQDQFVSSASTLRLTLSQIESAGDRVETVWNVLLQRAFSGQLTTKWREAHMKELLVEMEQQARALNLPLPLLATS